MKPSDTVEAEQQELSKHSTDTAVPWHLRVPTESMAALLAGCSSSDTESSDSSSVHSEIAAGGGEAGGGSTAGTGADSLALDITLKPQTVKIIIIEDTPSASKMLQRQLELSLKRLGWEKTDTEIDALRTFCIAAYPAADPLVEEIISATPARRTFLCLDNTLVSRTASRKESSFITTAIPVTGTAIAKTLVFLSSLTPFELESLLNKVNTKKDRVCLPRGDVKRFIVEKMQASMPHLRDTDRNIADFYLSRPDLQHDLMQFKMQIEGTKRFVHMKTELSFFIKYAVLKSTFGNQLLSRAKEANVSAATLLASIQNTTTCMTSNEDLVSDNYRLFSHACHAKGEKLPHLRKVVEEFTSTVTGESGESMLTGTPKPRPRAGSSFIGIQSLPGSVIGTGSAGRSSIMGGGGVLVRDFGKKTSPTASRAAASYAASGSDATSIRGASVVAKRTLTIRNARGSKLK